MNKTFFNQNGIGGHYVSKDKSMNKGLRIFYLFYDYPNVVPIHSYEVITHLAERNCIYVFGCIDSQFHGVKGWYASGIKLIKTPFFPARFIGEIGYLVCLFMKVLRYCYKLSPDVIYVRHGSLSLIGVLVAKLTRISVCLEVNDILTKRMKFEGPYILKKFWIWIYERISFSLADRIFPVTNGINNWICKNHKIKDLSIETIANGVNIQRFCPLNIRESRNKYDLPQDSIIVGYLGSLFPWAGLETLIDSVSTISSAYPSALFIIGGGEEPYRSLLQARVSKKGLSNHINFFGRIEWDDAATFINTMDICVAPAFFGNLESGISSQKVLAYLACGKPVVGSNIHGLGDMLEKEGIGVSFPMGDHNALTGAIIDLLSDKEKLKSMAVRGRDYVIRSHSWESIVDKIEDKCNELIMAKKR